MNCRSEVLEVSVEGRQVDEAMLALLHTILLHRSTGKFHYKKEGTYSIGTVGTQDMDCDFIDFTFVRVSSDELDRVIRKAVAEFKVLLITILKGMVHPKMSRMIQNVFLLLNTKEDILKIMGITKQFMGLIDFHSVGKKMLGKSVICLVINILQNIIFLCVQQKKKFTRG